MRVCSAKAVFPAAMLAGAIDMVASARGASIATADRTAAVPAMKSRSLGIRSSLTLRKRGDYAVGGVARYWDNPSAEAGRHPRQGGFVDGSKRHDGYPDCSPQGHPSRTRLIGRRRPGAPGRASPPAHGNRRANGATPFPLVRISSNDLLSVDAARSRAPNHACCG
jgi:hypothetical protein